jgi:hypothetical protein
LREQVNEAPDREQDAEQDRNKQDRGGKSFHVPNVTPSTADRIMPILLALALVGCSPGRCPSNGDRTWPVAAFPGVVRGVVPIGYHRTTRINLGSVTVIYSHVRCLLI